MDISEQYQGCIFITGQIHPAAAACVAARWTRNMGIISHLSLSQYHIPNQFSWVEAKKRTPLKNMKLDKFFLKLYVEQGGMLPNKLLVMLWGYCGFLQSYNH